MRQVQRSITAAIAMRRFVAALTGWFFIWGILTLVLRATTTIDSSILLYGAAGIPIALAAAYLSARRNIPDSEQIRAKLDAMNLDGGILMASAETEMPEWSQQITLSRLPTAVWRDRRTTGTFAAASVFLLMAFVVPKPQAPLMQDRTLAVDELIDELQAQIELVEEEEIIDEERADVLKENLKNIAGEADGDDPVKTWEALDHLADSLEDISAEAAEELMNMVEDSTTMEALANSLNQALEQNGASEELSKAMQELAAMMEAKNLLNQMEGTIPPELAEALQNAELSATQLQELAKCLSQCSNCSLCKMGKLCKASLIDADMLMKCKSMACDSEEALLAFMESDCENASCLAMMCACNIPGNGGITRGRGDAPLTWTDGTDESGAGFKEEVIQPSAIGGIDKSRLTGISKEAPQQNEQTVAAAGGALTGAKAGGGGAHKQRVLPQHKQTVMKYFHRGE